MNKFSDEMSIVKAIGIIHVVIAHIYPQLFSIIRMSYTFHMPLFYFISGYFYKENHEKDKIKYVIDKFRKNVGLFYLVYFVMIFFGSLFKWKYQISFGYVNWYSLFIKPFTTGSIGFWLGPAWFILSLFLVQFLFVYLFIFVKKVLNNDFKQLLFFLLLGVTFIYLNNNGWYEDEWLLLISRTFIGMMFYYFGFFYRKKIENRNIFNSKLLFIVLFSDMIISARFFPDTLIDMRNGFYHGHIILPILMACIGIYLTLFISKCLVSLEKKKNVFSVIGKYTFYIMVFHFFVNFLVSFILVKLNFVPAELWEDILLKSPIIPYLIEDMWPIYITLGILCPVFVGFLIEKTRLILRRFFVF